jgi:3-dehydroquinate synthetase
VFITPQHLQARLAESLGIAAKGTAERIVGLLERYRLPVARLDGASVDELIEAIRGDNTVRA